MYLQLSRCKIQLALVALENRNPKVHRSSERYFSETKHGIEE